MDLKKTWVNAGNRYYLQDVSTNQDSLEKSVYSIEVDEKGNLYLAKKANEFEFDFKVYGLEQRFIDRVIKTYQNTSGNIGLLLNGVKGTGKTITGKIISNTLGLPVIIIGTAYKGINTFLASIQQDVIIFIDEYEKVYEGQMGDGSYGEDNDATGDSTLLSLMSGAFDTIHRKVFILTTNRLWINENLLNRPGRIRYKKEFNDLTRAQIDEIIEDCLQDKKYRDELIEFLKPLKIITVDIVKSIISEINIHNEPPSVCCIDFNLEFKDDTFDIIRVPKTAKGKEVTLEEGVPAQQVNNFIQVCKNRWKMASLTTNENYYRAAKEPDVSNNVYTIYDGNYGRPEDAFTIRFQKSKGWHHVFAL